MKIRNSIYFTFLIVAFGCGASKQIMVSDAEVANAKKHYPDATVASIADGKSKYTANCGRCHGLKNPSDFTADRMNEILPKMFGKAKITDEALKQSISEYVYSKIN